jgi:outer membrane lipoprotein LolB
MTFGARLCSLLIATLFIAGCAYKIESKGLNHTENQADATFWAGRISLQIRSEPAQAFFAGFELKGRAENGELTLISPLGSILGVMRWSPGEATLMQAGSIKNFASTDELLTQATGAAVPLSALFDWLSGKNTSTPGWLADLSQLRKGRVTAQRVDPLPQADMRIVLDQ